MDQAYRDATTKMEALNVQLDYIIGWQQGYLGHPEWEEQLINEVYEAGRADGIEHNLDNIENWVK